MPAPTASPSPTRAALRGKAGAVGGYALRSLLPVALGMLTSLLVVRYHGAARWGEFVAVQLVLQLAAHVVGWGNKDHVLRALARDGAAPAAAVLGHFWARMVALYPPVIVATLAFGFWVGWSAEAGALATLWVALRVASQSFDAPVLHSRRFVAAAAADVIGALVVVAALAIGVVAGGGAPGVDALLVLFCAGEAVRAALLWLGAPELRAGPRPAPPSRVSVAAALRDGLPFFLVGAAGMLGSRVDLYCVTALLPHDEVARYQVYLSGLLWLQSVAALVLNPFSRELYRMGHRSLLRLTFASAAFGVVVAVVGVVALAWLLRVGYDLPLDGLMVGVGMLYVVQMFVHVPAVYALYKADRERVVLVTSVAITLANGALNLALIPILGAAGALVASAVVGWAAALVYFARTRALAVAKPMAGEAVGT